MGLTLILFSIYYPFLYKHPLKEFKQWIEEDSIFINYGVRIGNHNPNTILPFLHHISDTLHRSTIGFTGSLSNRTFSVFFTPVISTGTGNIYPERRWKERISGGFIDGGLNVNSRNLNMLLGNTRVVFTTSPFNNPILSLNTPPIPLLSYTIRFGSLTITQITGFLGEYSGTLYDPNVNPSDTVQINRYLLIHRFSFRPNKHLGIGFTEMGIAGINGFDPTFLNPISIYYEKQFNQWGNLNVLWNFDCVLKIKNTILYANLLIDDFQYEEDRWNEPDHMGINMGIFHKTPNITLVFEYNRFTRWVYGHFYVWQRYTYQDYPLGMVPASDFESFLLKLEKGLLSLDLEYRKKGETNPSTPWPVDYTKPLDEENSFPHNNFLSGVIEKNISIKLSLNKEYDKWSILTQVGVLYSKNHSHTQGVDRVFPVIHVCLKGRCPIPLEEK